MSRDRYKNTLGTAGCCPFDSPFPAIVVFLSARASTSFLSMLSLASSFFFAFSALPPPPPPRYLRPCRIFLRLQPFLFFTTLSPPTRRVKKTSRVSVCVSMKGHARVRGGEPYVDLMSAIMT